MRKNLTEIVFILDRSGSMNGLERDTIGGFNSMIEQQKKTEGEALISTVLFDNVSEVLHDRVDVKDIRPMTDRDYTVRGCTALLDAIGGAIHHIGNIHKYARPEDVPEHTMFVITTDGMENASRRYDSEKVKQMIERQKAKYGWEFLFLGANIDAVETASQFGIGADRAVNYQCDSEGTALNYEVVSEAISASGCKLVKIVLGKVLNGVVTVPETTAVPLNYFDDVTFIGDSLTLGMESYKTGLPNAKFCAYKGIGPNAIATDMTCMREDGTSEKPLEKLAAQNPKAVYILLGTNVLGTDGDYNGFLAYYRLMLDAVAQAVPGATIYIQSITTVQLSASVEHPGLNQTRLKQVNQELALIAQEKNCYYLDLWDVLADENGNLKADIAQEDGYHLKSAGYTLWVDYLRTHTVG